MRLGKHYRGEYLGYGGAEILEDFAGYSPAGEMLLKTTLCSGRGTFPRTIPITTLYRPRRLSRERRERDAGV